MDHSDLICGMDVECDHEKPDYVFRLYLAQFINWFVNRTFREVGFLIDPHRKKLFKVQVFELYSKNETNGVFLQLIHNFNRYMADNATTIFPHTSIYDMDLYPDPPQLLQGKRTANFYNINGQPINTKIINLVIAAHIIHKILSESSERRPVIAPIRVSQLQTYMELLPSDDNEELIDGYLETLGRNQNDDNSALMRSATPLQAEIILHAENFEYYKGGRHSISEALARYPGLAIQDVRLLVSSLPSPPNGPPPNGGSKKRNKSKIKKQKRSNKKSRRHHTRKRLSRRNAKRFY
jgi:hypothetical protein